MTTTARRLSATLGLLGILGLFLLCGCASTDPNAESDMPWNAPQPWEGSPGIPGFEGR